MMTISQNKSSALDIENHLRRCDEFFIPNLASYINIEVYAEKLFKSATRYEIWKSYNLISLLAGYSNYSQNVFYISNISVEKEFISKSYGKKLIEYLIQEIKLSGLNSIELEVFKKNRRAINFYFKNNFKVISQTANKLRLKLIV